jgi:hypothetical protein
LAGVGPVETLNNVNMQKIQIILSEQQRMKKYLPNSVGFHSNSLFKVGIAWYEVKIRYQAHVPVHSKRIQHGNRINSEASVILADKINWANKI